MIITILLGDNQDFAVANAIVMKHGGTVRGPVTVLQDDVEEAVIPTAQWRAVKNELTEAKYELD